MKHVSLYAKFLEGTLGFGVAVGSANPHNTDFDFFPEEQARPEYEQEQEIIRTGRPLLNVEEQTVWPDGRVDWSLSTKMPLRDEHGEIIGTFGISRDITEMKEAQAALEQAYAAVEQQVAERTEELKREQEESARLQVEMRYQIKASHAQRSLVYPFYLIPEEA